MVDAIIWRTSTSVVNFSFQWIDDKNPHEEDEVSSTQERRHHAIFNFKGETTKA